MGKPVAAEVEIEKDYGLDEIAEIVGMSTRWVRNRMAAGAEHQVYGHKRKMTRSQIEQLRASHTRRVVEPVDDSVTTGRKRSA